MRGWYYRMHLSLEDSLKFERNFLDLRNSNESLINHYNTKHNDGFDFIGSAFFWDRTPEGEDYWYEVALKLREISPHVWIKINHYDKKIMV